MKESYESLKRGVRFLEAFNSELALARERLMEQDQVEEWGQQIESMHLMINGLTEVSKALQCLKKTIS